MNPRLHRSKEVSILYDADRIPHPEDVPFDFRRAVAPEPVIGSGRGGTWRERVNDLTAALRQYRRGGMVRHLLTTAYLWTGLDRTRAFREFRLLASLHAGGLPVPAPLATRVVRTALWYRAELLTEWLPGTRSLADLLGDAELDDARWRAVGATLRRFHDAGVDHADLNAHNILLDGQGGVFIIDLDRGRLRTPHARWQRGNLSRLRRSLEKVHATGRALYYSRSGWATLLNAYGGHTGSQGPASV